MPSSTNDISYQPCTFKILEKFGKKMTVFGKTESKPEIASSINRISLPKDMLYPTGIMLNKFQNTVLS